MKLVAFAFLPWGKKYPCLCPSVGVSFKLTLFSGSSASVCIYETVCIHWEAARSSTASAAFWQDNWCATFKPYTRIWCYNTIVVAFWIAFLVHFRVYKSPDKICIVETCSKWVLENQKPIHFVQKGKRYLVLKCISLKPFDFWLLGITKYFVEGWVCT